MAPASSARERVLIVDDDASVRRALKRELESTFEVVEATSVAGAISCLATSPDVCAVISDLDLGPGADGLTVLRHAAIRLPAAARMMVSGTAVEHALDRAVVEKLIRKPWSRGGVLGAVVASLSSRPTRVAETAACDLRGVDAAVLIAVVGAAGYSVAFEDGAFCRCLVNANHETWAGYGRDRTEALLDAVERMHPSKSSRRLLRARLVKAADHLSSTQESAVALQT